MERKTVEVPVVVMEPEEEDLEHDLFLSLYQHMTKELDAILPEIPNEKLGALFRMWFTESEHNGWEGYERAEVLAMSKAFRDMALCYEFVEEEIDDPMGEHHGRNL